jgi:phospholipase/carboxylesterase
MKKALLLFLLVFSVLLKAQLQADLSLPYLVREPSVKTDKPPVLILLHGYGSNEADLFGLQAQLPAQFLVVSVRAPIAMGAGSFQWFRMETVNGVMQGNPEDLKSSREKIKALIPEVTAKYKADPKQVYLCGFSQGGMMCYEVGLTSPELLKGIAPLSGKIFESLKALVKSSAALKALRIFIGHGDADTRVAYTYATEADAYLKKLGLSPALHSYKGLQHSISEIELKELRLWLEGK